MTEVSRELQTALNAVQTAAWICRRIQAAISPDVLEKRDRSPVTVADYASQAVICRTLNTACPGIPIVAEEDAAELGQRENAPFLDRVCEELARVGIDGSREDICRWIDLGNGDPAGGRYWTLDPIDGTKGFLRGDQYAVSLALLEQGKIQLGVLACPNLAAGSQVRSASETPSGVLLLAERGQGAWWLPLKLDESAEVDLSEVEPRRAQVSQTDDPSAARLCESVEKAHSAHGKSAQVAQRLDITAEPVRIDSQAKYAAVALGAAELYLRLPMRSGYAEKIWDHAGGVLVVEEAGGRVTDMDGQPLDWTHGKRLQGNRGVVVSNSRLHDAVLTALRNVESNAAGMSRPE